MAFIPKLKQLLSVAGLSEEEIQFYIEVLKKPNSTIYDLAKNTGIKKDRAYKVCESLVARKLVDFEKDGKWKRLRAMPVSGFIEKLNSQGRQLYKAAEKLNEMQKLLPMLSVIDQDMSFEFFEHDEAGERFVDLTYLKWDKIFGYGDFDSVIPAISEESDRQFIRRRVRRGANSFTVLANPVGYSLELIKNDEREMRRSRVIFDDKIKDYFVGFAPEVNTFGIWMKQSSGLVTGAIVKNALLTKMHQNIFEHLDNLSQEFSFRELEK